MYLQWQQTIHTKSRTQNRKQVVNIVSESEREDSDNEGDWLPRTAIKLSGTTPCINIKPQYKYIQALIHRAVDLGERYIFLGPPEDDAIAIGDVPNMTTPFSVTGLHSIAFSGLLNAAQQLGYTEEGDIYDRLNNGSEESYVKPLRYHVRDSIIIRITIVNLMFLNNRSFKDSGLLERWLFRSFIHHFLRSLSSTRPIKEQ